MFSKTPLSLHRGQLARASETPLATLLRSGLVLQRWQRTREKLASCLSPLHYDDFIKQICIGVSSRSKGMTHVILKHKAEFWV